MKLYALVLDFGDYDEFVNNVFVDKERACQAAQEHSLKWRDVVHVVEFDEGSMVSSVSDEDVVAVYGQ